MKGPGYTNWGFSPNLIKFLKGMKFNMLVLEIVLGLLAVFFTKYARSLYEEDENSQATFFTSLFAAALFIAYSVLLIINWNKFSIPFIFLLVTAISFVMFETGNDAGFPTYIALALTIIAFTIAFIV